MKILKKPMTWSDMNLLGLKVTIMIFSIVLATYWNGLRLFVKEYVILLFILILFTITSTLNHYFKTRLYAKWWYWILLLVIVLVFLNLPLFRCHSGQCYIFFK